MPHLGGRASPPFWGHGRRWTGCAVIPVYRDLRRRPGGRSGAGLNVKWPQKREAGAVVASTLVNGRVPVTERETAQREAGIAATSEQAIGRGGRNPGYAALPDSPLQDMRPGAEAFWRVLRLCRGSVDRSIALPRLRLLVDGVVMPAIESGGSVSRALSPGRHYTGVVALRGLHR